MLSDATVVAESEAERVLLGPLAAHVELVSVLKDILVAVGRLVRRNDSLARLDELCRSQSVMRQRFGFPGFITFPPISTSSLAVRFMAIAEAVW
jgi:hypothetical protein